LANQKCECVLAELTRIFSGEMRRMTYTYLTIICESHMPQSLQSASRRRLQTTLTQAWCLRRKCTCTRRRCRRLSTPSRAPRRTTSSSGRPPRPPTATSAKVSSGALPGKGCAAQSAGSSATKSARTYSTPTACRVSTLTFFLYFSRLDMKREGTLLCLTCGIRSSGRRFNLTMLKILVRCQIF